MDVKPIIILGGGGHARVVVDTLFVCDARVLGFVDRDPQKTELEGLQRLGGDEYILSSFDPDEIMIANGVGSIGKPGARLQLFNRFKQHGFSFVTIIHPRAVVSPRAILKEGVQVMAGAIIQPAAHIGENTIVNTGAVVDHDCTIGAHVHIGPGATLSGEVTVGAYSHIGTGASVIQGIKIGSRSIVGAGSVVIRPVEDDVTVVGVPAVQKG